MPPIPAKDETLPGARPAENPQMQNSGSFRAPEAEKGLVEANPRNLEANIWNFEV